MSLGTSEPSGHVFRGASGHMSAPTARVTSLWWTEAVDTTHQHSFTFWLSPEATCALATDRGLVVTTIPNGWLTKIAISQELY